MAVVEGGSSTANRANVDGSNNLFVNTPGNNADGTVRGGGSAQAGNVTIITETDSGTATGARLVVAPETDHDFRFRLHETVLDEETFNYTAQNTGKYNSAGTTMTATYTASGLTTNGGNILTASTDVRVRSYAQFPLFTSEMLYIDARLALTAAMPTNTTIDVGLFTDIGSTPFTPNDGVCFRFDSGGNFGVVVNAGAISQVTLTGLTMPINQFVKLTIAVSVKRVEFFVDDVLYGVINQSASTIQPFVSAAQPFAIRHAITAGAASTVIQAKLGEYQVTLGGSLVTSTAHEQGARCWGSHQGLGGGTMGSLAANYGLTGNSVTPAGVAGSNTAAIATGLGGQVSIIAQLAGALGTQTDCILTSYQVPLGTAAVQGRRLAIRGVNIFAANLGAAVATTETSLAYSLCFGHTAVSLATAEGAAAKTPRREGCGILSWPIGAAIGAGPREGRINLPFEVPIYANPGEFVAVAAKFLQGTATPNQIIYNQITFDYGWE
jgi:hypothetical protein